ncbi:TRAF3-interacting protein 1 [Quaeritorhiza haematococci]|nr:TRAF3-interacting protein 1 [Quaeritorhiza haematococci]
MASASAPAAGPAAAATGPPTLDDHIKKTIDILGRIIKKTPLNPKLLCKPPFRYLHDLFSELLRTIPTFAAGLYTADEMNYEIVKDSKEGKVAYLTKMIDCMGLATGVEIRANPLKIVAGLEPEETNMFLQLIGKVIIKKRMRFDEYWRVNIKVAKLRATLRIKRKRQRLNRNQQQRNAPARPDASESKKAEPTPANSEQRKQEAAPKPQQAISKSREQLAQADEKKSPPAPATQPKRAPEPAQIETVKSSSTSNLAASTGPKPMPAVRQENSSGSIPDLNAAEGAQATQEENEARLDEAVFEEARMSTMVKRRERPSSARPAPPKIRQKQQTVDEVSSATAPAIIQDSQTRDADDEEFVMIGQEETPDERTFGPLANEKHGGLVRKILETKKELEGKSTDGGDSNVDYANMPKDKVAARKEIEALREAVQTLCRSSHPLGKTIDYIQEDVDSMNKEFEMWCAENKKYKMLLEDELRITADVLSPLEMQLKQIEANIEEQIERISNAKSIVLQNEVTIQNRYLNIAHPI